MVAPYSPLKNFPQKKQKSRGHNTKKYEHPWLCLGIKDSDWPNSKSTWEIDTCHIAIVNKTYFCLTCIRLCGVCRPAKICSINPSPFLTSRTYLAIFLRWALYTVLEITKTRAKVSILTDVIWNLRMSKQNWFHQLSRMMSDLSSCLDSSYPMLI